MLGRPLRQPGQGHGLGRLRAPEWRSGRHGPTHPTLRADRRGRRQPHSSTAKAPCSIFRQGVLIRACGVGGGRPHKKTRIAPAPGPKSSEADRAYSKSGLFSASRSPKQRRQPAPRGDWPGSSARRRGRRELLQPGGRWSLQPSWPVWRSWPSRSPRSVEGPRFDRGQAGEKRAASIAFQPDSLSEVSCSWVDHGEVVADRRNDHEAAHRQARARRARSR